MAETVTYTSKITRTVTPEAALALDAGDNTYKQSALDKTLTLDANSSTPGLATIGAEVVITLSSGAYTLDLTAVPDTVRGSLDFSGKKVRLIKLVGKSDNANPITVTPGETNGYPLGGASGSWSVNASDELLAYVKDSGQVVDSTHKTLDFSGTGSQVLYLSLDAG